MSDISVNLIGAWHVPVAWVLVKEKLEESIKEWGFGEFDAMDLYDDLCAGRAQLWIVNDGEYNIRLIAITKVLSYPKKKRFFIDVLVGEKIDDLEALLKRGDAWMKEKGISEMEAHVRPALARVLERKGNFKRSRVVLFREPQDANISEA